MHEEAKEIINKKIEKLIEHVNSAEGSVVYFQKLLKESQDNLKEYKRILQDLNKSLEKLGE